MQPLGNEVNGLWVHPESQGLGIGKSLLRSAEREIAAAGHDTAWVTCSGYNSRALGFYLRTGYLEARRSTLVLEPGLIDEAIILERSVAALRKPDLQNGFNPPTLAVK